MGLTVFLAIAPQSTIQDLWAAVTGLSDQHAYFAMYRHYYHYLRLLGAKRNLQTELVKDAINEVFLHIWEQRVTLKHIHTPHNYILTVFFRRVFHAARQNEKLVDTLSGESPFGDGAEISFVEGRIDEQHSSRANQLLSKQLEQLPERQREMLYQKFYLGRTYQEIAENLGISVNTVYNTVYTALGKLKDVLGKPGVLLSVSIILLQNFFWT